MLYRNTKTGKLYRILLEAILESDSSPAIVYVSLSDGKIGVCPVSEFFDGRFQAISSKDVPPRQPRSPFFLSVLPQSESVVDLVDNTRVNQPRFF